MKRQKRRSIGHGMKNVGIIFTVVMCVLLSTEMILMIKGSMYSGFDRHMKEVLTHIERTTDLDDLQECIRTGVASEKYNALQQKINNMVDEFELLYIYIGIPARTDDGTGILISVVSSTSDAERAAGDTEEYPIGYYDESFYTEEQIASYFQAMERPDGFSSFTEKSGQFESSYIVVKPLLDASGKPFALLCADMSLALMHRNVRTYTFSSTALILLICIAFSVCVGTWLGRNVSAPLSKLEKSARGFAIRSHRQTDLSELAYEPPAIHTDNEIESLSDAITQMSADMKDYAETILAEEKRAETAEKEVEDISRIAYEDELTKTKSKVAYDAKKAELAEKIAAGDAKFALVIIDVNNLKHMNDTYGLDCGNRYIVSAGKVVSEIYPDTPVYRVEGDAFAVILEGEQYYQRDELFDLLEERFRMVQADQRLKPWERCSAAAGMTEFSPDADTDVDQVYRRAEKIMLRNKRMMKNDYN